MKSITALLFGFAFFFATASAFAPAVSSGSFVVVSPPRAAGMTAPAEVALPRTHARTVRSSELFMGGKMAKFGVFSPAVYAAKLALGTEKLNKLRGKAISLHSQYIGDFCLWAGAYHLRTQLIKKAKTNGDVLGFLV